MDLWKTFHNSIIPSAIYMYLHIYESIWFRILLYSDSISSTRFTDTFILLNIHIANDLRWPVLRRRSWTLYEHGTDEVFPGIELANILRLHRAFWMSPSDHGTDRNFCVAYPRWSGFICNDTSVSRNASLEWDSCWKPQN